MTDPLHELARVDRRLEAELGGPPRSLAAGRARATPLAELARTLLAAPADAALADAFARGLGGLALAQLDAFPGNLFWDFDFPAAALLRDARRRPDPADTLDEAFALACELQRLYGRHTPIAFAYAHDFTYGLDWAKWVAREPDQDGSVGPFDPRFLHTMRRRAHELLDLIARDDPKYPTLPPGRPRNPFPFSRAPADEARLLAALAARDLLPVAAWRIDAAPRCDRPFGQLRLDLARELGIPPAA